MTAAAKPEGLARVAARVREESARLGEVADALREAMARWHAAKPDLIHVHWVGGPLHDLYTGIEKAFAEISPELNGVEGVSEGWHRSLLHTMTLDLPGFRPAVIRRDLELRLLELLKFRHLYRNLYSFELRWDRVRALGVDALALWPDIAQDFSAFAAALDAIATP